MEKVVSDDLKPQVFYKPKVSFVLEPSRLRLFFKSWIREILFSSQINPEPLTPNLVTKPLKRVTFCHMVVSKSDTF